MDNVILACAVGDLAWLKRSLSADIDPASTRNKDGLNSLHLASKNGHLDCVKYLLNNYSIDVDEAVPATGLTALHLSISTSNGTKSLQCMKLLLERGANLNKQSKSGQTALHLAAKKGHTKCLKRLLEQGAVSDTQDKDEYTACDIATLYGHYECARLLRALHWAKEKDASLSSEMRSKAARQRQEKERKAIHAKLRKEAANEAYKNWAQTKSKPSVPPPGACKERQELRSQSQTPHTCSSCIQASTRVQSAKQVEPQVTSPVTVSLQQAKRNTESTGKPDKMHPYTNYPPKKPAKSAKAKKKSSGKSGRSSRAMKLSRPNHTPSHNSRSPSTTNRCKNEEKEEHSPCEHDTESPILSGLVDEVSGNNSEQNVRSDEYGPPCELNLGFLNGTISSSEMESSPRDEKTIIRFIVGGLKEEEEDEKEEEEEEEEEEEDIAFHEVGKPNSLDALGLPSALTKDQTPAEVIQLLRHIASTKSSHKHHKSKSYHFTRRPSLTNRLERRFSLGSIPEGQMVTNYSGEFDSMSSLDENFLGMSRHYVDATWEREEDDQLQLEEDDEMGECYSFFENEEDAEDEERVQEEDDRKDEENNEGEEEGENKREEYHANGIASKRQGQMTTSNKSRPQPTLNIINLAWDPATNSVQASVTKSTMVPANHHVQGRISRSRPVAICTRSTPISPQSSLGFSPINIRHRTSPERNDASSIFSNPTPPKSNGSIHERRSPSPRHGQFSSSPLSPPRDREVLQEVTGRNRSTESRLLLPALTSSYIELKTAEQRNIPTSPATTADKSTFPAHSLFGGMNGIASKSMISFKTPDPLLASDPASPANAATFPQPKLKRRIHSAPNLMFTNSENKPLKISVFTYGGRLE